MVLCHGAEWDEKPDESIRVTETLVFENFMCTLDNRESKPLKATNTWDIARAKHRQTNSDGSVCLQTLTHRS